MTDMTVRFAASRFNHPHPRNRRLDDNTVERARYDSFSYLLAHQADVLETMDWVQGEPLSPKQLQQSFQSAMADSQLTPVRLGQLSGISTLFLLSLGENGEGTMYRQAPSAAAARRLAEENKRHFARLAHALNRSPEDLRTKGFNAGELEAFRARQLAKQPRVNLESDWWQHAYRVGGKANLSTAEVLSALGVTEHQHEQVHYGVTEKTLQRWGKLFDRDPQDLIDNGLRFMDLMIARGKPDAPKVLAEAVQRQIAKQSFQA